MYVATIEHALATDSEESVKQHVARLREILERVEKERIDQLTRVNFGILIKQLPSYKATMKRIEDIDDPQMQSYLRSLIERGEGYVC